MNNLADFTLKLALSLVIALLLLFNIGQWRPVSADTNDVNCNAPPVVCKGGALTSNEIWQAGNIYVITSDLTVGPAATLTLEAGAIVKFADYCCDKRNLFVEGTLQVNGTDTQKVYFTSIYDDALGGDTNNDSGNSQPVAGNWDNLVFKNGSHGVINHAEFRYGDYGRGGAIRLEGSSPTLDHVTVKYSPWAAISALPTDTPTITNFASQGVGGGMEIRGGALTTNATWDQTSIVYIMTSDFTVGAGATLNIAAGVILKFVDFCCDKRNLFVEGTLNVTGNATQEVYFTSIYDDAIGGDTNNDSGNSQARAGNWSGIHFAANSIGNFAHAVIRYAGVSRTTGALHIKDAVVTIIDSVISNNIIGLFAEGATAEVQAQMGNSTITVNKSGLYSNGEYDVFAKAGTSVVADNNWWGSSNPQPKVSGNVTTASPCADEVCTVALNLSRFYLPLVRR